MRSIFAVVLCIAVSASASAAWAQRALLNLDDVPHAVPTGITLQERPGRGAFAPATTILGDAAGRTIYTFDADTKPGTSTCVADCAAAWPPVLVPANAEITVAEAWSVIKRPDGAKQWAYRGKPVYTHAKDEKPGDAKGDKIEEAWHVVLFAPQQGVRLPPGIAASEIPDAAGWVFVDLDGKPLYTFADDPKGGKPTCVAGLCAKTWKPFLAAQLARPVGDFTVVRRDDGIYQWTHKGKPLYRYANEVDPGDTGGNGLDGKWRTAMLARMYMPAEATMWHNHFGGNNAARADGMTLYTRGRGAGVASGHSLRAGTRGSAATGRLLGTSTCDKECARTWPPLHAPANAVSTGYWDVVTREDGARQWAYRGFPVYTFVGDKLPGQMNGVDTVEFITDADTYKKFGTQGNVLRGAAALVWAAAAP